MCGTVNAITGALGAAAAIAGINAPQGQGGMTQQAAAPQQSAQTQQRKQDTKQAKYGAFRDANQRSGGSDFAGFASTLLTGPLGANLMNLNLGRPALLGR